MATVNSNGLIRNKQDEIAFLTKYIASLEADLTKPENALPGYQKELLTRIAASKAQLAGVEAAVAEAPAVAAAQPTASSTSASAPTPVAPGPGTTGTVIAAAAPPKAGAPVYDPNIAYKAEVNGVGNTGKETVTKQAEVNAANNAQILVQPQANVLDKFSSYTYQASVYLMSPTQYDNLLVSVDKNIPDAQLLFQSGGTAGKGNKFFDNDFYIDSITLENMLAGKQTQSAHMTSTLKFTVTEPMGITLLDRLKDAVADFSPTDASGRVNFSAAQFLMAIRFFGYDQDGKLVSPGLPEMVGNTIKSRAVIEKYIPFLITKINWSVGTKLVSYDIEGAPVGQVIGGSVGRGTVPFDLEVTAGTVGEFFTSKAVYSTAKADAATSSAAPRYSASASLASPFAP